MFPDTIELSPTHTTSNPTAEPSVATTQARSISRPGKTEALPLKRFLPVLLRLLNRVIPACPFDMPRLPDQLELHFPHAVFPNAVFRIARQRAVLPARETTMRRSLRSPTIAALAAIWPFSVPAVNAQDQSPPVQMPSPGASNPTPELSDQKLDATAAAILRVAGLKQDYQQRIAAAAPAEKERIAEEAFNALAKAVTDQGLSVDEYTSILEVAQADPEVREKIRQRIASSNK